jgi:hypothetical protein
MVYKYSVAKGVMETISTRQDFIGDDAVKLLHHLKLTLVPVLQLPPLTVPTPPMRRSLTDYSPNWSNSWQDLVSSSNSVLSVGSDAMSVATEEGLAIVGASSGGDASI